MKDRNLAQILVLAEDELQRLIYVDMLAMHGYLSENADSIKGAKFILENSDLSFVIFDEHKLEGTVKSMIQTINDQHRAIYSMIISSDQSEQRQCYLRSLGYDRLLTKPIDLSILIHIVDEYFVKSGNAS